MLGIKSEHNPITGEYAKKLDEIIDRGNKMRTIEERAKEYADKESVNIFSNGTDEVYKKVLYEDYVKIANEQKKVDIDNACDKVFTVLMNKTHFLGDDCKMIADELHKALEEE